MIYLCQNTITGRLSVESNPSGCHSILAAPFVPAGTSNKYREKVYEIEVPNSQFSFRIDAFYRKTFGILRMANSGKPLIKMSEIFAGRVFMESDPGRILISTKNQNDDDGWKECFDYIVDAYNNLQVWQINEIINFITELRNVVSCNHEYVVNNKGKDSKTYYKGEGLLLMKARLISTSIKVLEKTEMTNLSNVIEDLSKIISETIPLIKEQYLATHALYTQLSSQFKEIELAYHQAEKASNHIDEYVEYVLKGRYAKNKEDAERKFKKKYSKEASLLELLPDINNRYYERKSTLEHMLKANNDIAECIQLSMNLMAREGKLADFLLSISK